MNRLRATDRLAFRLDLMVNLAYLILAVGVILTPTAATFLRVIAWIIISCDCICLSLWLLLLPMRIKLCRLRKLSWWNVFEI